MESKLLLVLSLLPFFQPGMAKIASSSSKLPAEAEEWKEGMVKPDTRKSKLFPVFQVVKFPNSGCSGTSGRNGTCYTAGECSSKGGSSSGTCASGYGVCCIFSLSCGGTTSQNCTYLVQTSTTKAPSTDPCTYTICRCNSNICRIRLDFTTFQIAGPQVGTTSNTGTTVATADGGGIGDCITDSFSLSSPGKDGSPVICGFNTGQHMIVDAGDVCSLANFDIGATADTREWNIKVTQYTCGDENGGPPGCLQYFTGVTGRISSYNFPTTATVIGAQTTHLSDQDYEICIRQEVGKCFICYTTSITNTVGNIPEADTETAQTSFGLSVTAGIGTNVPPATAASGSNCATDYLAIPNAVIFQTTLNKIMASVDKICGRVFSTNVQPANRGITGLSVCSVMVPFRMQFYTNCNEATVGTDAITTAQTNEQSQAPGGIVGFSLNYVQQSC